MGVGVDPLEKADHRRSNGDHKWMMLKAAVVVQVAVVSKVQKFLARLYAVMLPFFNYSYSLGLHDMGKTNY